jgi:hypothetical protein
MLAYREMKPRARRARVQPRQIHHQSLVRLRIGHGWPRLSRADGDAYSHERQRFFSRSTRARGNHRPFFLCLSWV